MDKVDFSQPLRHLDIVGLNPFKNDGFSKIRRGVTATFFILCTYLSYSEFFLHSNNFQIIVRGSEIVFPLYYVNQIFGNLLLLIDLILE